MRNRSGAVPRGAACGSPRRCLAYERVTEAKMIDFHTHILPGIDDGSKDTAMTEAMIDLERGQGITHICATPHFYAFRRTVDEFLDRRDMAFVKICRRLRFNGMRIHRGAEVYYFGGMGRSDQIPRLCLQGTEVLLLEMPFAQWNRDVHRDVEDLIFRQHLTVVLAHVERYAGIQKDKTVWDEILDMPLYVQLNGESLLKHSKSRKFCMKMIGERDKILLGSDCHNLTYRAPNMDQAMEAVRSRAGAKRAERMQQQAAQLMGL